ncbi:MAG: aldehyde dehydrogenase family protein [Alphaproteobacteria bacterium]|nr:aldehyde dehydrogenase family protein [Alphaproteobacteria bacterium]MCB9695502.1 aldehyde dehydrogenase family protein [Alphaproteobacteria bacterium]
MSRLGLQAVNSGAATTSGFLPTHGPELDVHSPIDGALLAKVKLAGLDEYEKVVGEAARVFADWRMVPAPKRGEILREVGDALRAHKEDLGRLISVEVGKILSEGMGEVQESVDMADLCVGMSRQLSGLTMHSERPGHRMYEQWHPLGVVGVITAFNFPNAVWAWNAMVAAAAGDTVVWKPSLKAPLTAIATHRICDEVFQKYGWGGVFGLVIGEDKVVGEAMIRDRRVPLVSATGSTHMGRHVGQVVAERLGRSLLELGGNNAIIIHEDANLDLALRAIVFASCGTSGQRCTTNRRLFVHESIADKLVPRIQRAYESIPIGNPLEAGTLMGPLIDEQAVQQYLHACDQIRAQGGEILTGGERVEGPGFYVRPTLVRARADMEICKEETFAPILYVFTYKDLSEAIRLQNDVPQGLSSAIFTDSFRASERFLSHAGSDCGIANVNIGTSGAEIGGAFGGEKETGGGREAGSDSWKAYMRRQTCTMNWSDELPLAQGVRFDL